MLAPEDGVAIVAMSNFAASDRDYIEQFVNAAARIMLALKPSEPSATNSITATQLSTEEAKKKVDEVLASYVTRWADARRLRNNQPCLQRNFEVSGIAMSGPVEIYAKAPNLMLLVLQMPGRKRSRTDLTERSAGNKTLTMESPIRPGSKRDRRCATPTSINH